MNIFKIFVCHSSDEYIQSTNRIHISHYKKTGRFCIKHYLKMDSMNHYDCNDYILSVKIVFLNFCHQLFCIDFSKIPLQIGYKFLISDKIS